ncbi:MAG: cytochrome c biogenesis protein CcdA [Candidatus Sulfopaludibacter sp.]|nr:cytochrome c biogenesis protein CcdA [Candidatus Sulfopaludibacter sp.]
MNPSAFICVHLRPVLLAFVFSAGALAQQHAQFTAQPDPATVAPGGKTLVRIEVKIDSGWHLYSGSSPEGIPISFQSAAAEKLRLLQPPVKRAFDPVANAETESYENAVTFLLELTLRKDAPAGPAEIPISARYQTCSATQCVPGRWSETLKLTVDPAAPAASLVIPAGYSEPKPPAASSAGAPQPPQSQGWGLFLLTAFGFGLASIFTPCVFPMIPITMSFFLNRQSGGRQDGVVQAIVFCLGIIVLFSGIGLLTTLLLGPAGVKNLGGNPWVNGFIAALFIAFGLSLLGAFEINVPSSILTKLNQSSEKGGFGGTLLMGLTFSLSSFACVGPFVGTLLAASVGGGETMRPLLGMMSFAAGLALPFFLLALFPSYLKRMPRSGGWLARVKVVMGFIILAASLKYIASLDATLQWGFLTRDRFLAAWLVLFAMAGLYLLGFVRLEGIKADETMGLGRLLSGLVLLIFAISLLPGMFGGNLGDLEAYVPAAAEGAASPGGSQAAGLVWMKDQYRAALDKARTEGKLVFVDFTGYSCANCHWMRANILSRPEISARLGKFVLVELYTDGTDAASEANAKLEAEKFKTISQPLYVILQPDETVVARFEGLTHNPAEFQAFLEKTAAPSSPSIVSKFTSLQGGPLDPAAFTGKVIVVDFWATYCGPCIKEIPGFNKIHKDFAGQGVAVLGVGMDEEGAELIVPFLKKHPMDYPVALGSPAVNKEYNLEGLPVTLVIDRNGKQVKRFDGLTPEDELRAAVEQAARP